MTRWQIKASRSTKTWFHACEVTYLDAETEADARALVEADPQLKVWAITPATPEIEAKYHAWQARCREWLARVQRGENPRGLL